jgi:hypothetical protein
MRRYWLVLAMIPLVLLAGGCKEDPPPPPPSEVPPEPTPEQIHSELRAACGPIFNAVPFAPTVEARDAAVAALRGLVSRHQSTENGRIAIGRLSTDITTFIRTARDMDKPKKPGIELAGVMLHEAVNPTDDRYAKRKETLKIMLAMPRVKVRGFMDAGNGETVVFLLVIDPDTREEKVYKVREGEEFHEVLRLVRIIGNQQAVEIEYLPLGELYELLGPRDTPSEADWRQQQFQ